MLAEKVVPKKVMAGTFSFFPDTGPGRMEYGSLFLMPETPELREQRADGLTECQEREPRERMSWAVGEIKQPTRQVLGVYCDRRESGKRTAWRKLFRDPLCSRRSTRRSTELET